MPGATKSRRQGEARQVDTHTCPKCRSNLYAPDFDGWSCVACGYKRRNPRNNTQKAPPSEAETRALRQREWREKRDWNNAKAMWRTIKGQHERTNATPRHPAAKPRSAPAKPALQDLPHFLLDLHLRNLGRFLLDLRLRNLGRFRQTRTLSGSAPNSTSVTSKPVTT